MLIETTSRLFELKGYVDSCIDANTQDSEVSHIPISILVRIQRLVNETIKSEYPEMISEQND